MCNDISNDIVMIFVMTFIMERLNLSNLWPSHRLLRSRQWDLALPVNITEG